MKLALFLGLKMYILLVDASKTDIPSYNYDE